MRTLAWMQDATHRKWFFLVFFIFFGSCFSCLLFSPPSLLVYLNTRLHVSMQLKHSACGHDRGLKAAWQLKNNSKTSCRCKEQGLVAGNWIRTTGRDALSCAPSYSKRNTQKENSSPLSAIWLNNKTLLSCDCWTIQTERCKEITQRWVVTHFRRKGTVVSLPSQLAFIWALFSEISTDCCTCIMHESVHMHLGHHACPCRNASPTWHAITFNLFQASPCARSPARTD